MPAASSDLPESRPGKPVAFCLVLLRMGFTCAPPVARRAVVSYSAFPPLPHGIPFPGNRGRYISVALALESPPRTLSGILPCEARTFLTRRPPHGGTDGRDHSSCSFSSIIIYPFMPSLTSPISCSGRNHALSRIILRAEYRRTGLLFMGRENTAAASFSPIEKNCLTPGRMLQYGSK